jgi:3-hydroxyisobutyrate dehydrogenase-like beta-hydroxyacid dehydrogenase
VNVGVNGLGHMGGPMSRSVLAAGHDLVLPLKEPHPHPLRMAHPNMPRGNTCAT